MRSAREEIQLSRDEALRVKQMERIGTEKKVEVKKRLADFRQVRLIHSPRILLSLMFIFVVCCNEQKLKAHLKSKHDPLLGSIMRCVDESMVYHFMEKYEGYSMSVEAILVLIGNALGSSSVSPDPLVLSTERDIVGNEKRRKDREHRQDTIDIQEVTDSYRRDKSSPSGRAMNSVIFDAKYVGGKPKARPRRTGLSDEVTGVAPRKYSADFIRPLTAEKTLGSGFRTTRSRGTGSRSGMLLTPLHGTEDSTHNSLQQFPLAILGSDHMKSSMELFASQHLIEKSSLGHSLSHLLLAERDEDEMSVGTQDAISVMHEQLLEEKMLPSMQPERPLSDAQLHDLGSKTKSFEDIMREVRGGGPSPGKTGRIIVNPPMSAAKNMNRVASQGGEGSAVLNGNSVELSAELSPARPAAEQPPGSGDGVTNIMTIEGDSPRRRANGGSASPLKPLPLYGSVLSATDVERFDQLTSIEIDFYRNSFGLAAKSPPGTHKLNAMSDSLASSSRTNLMSKGGGDRSGLVQPPRGLKSRNKYESQEGLVYLPVSPFKTFEERTQVKNCGVPSGSGLVLWRARQKVTPTGRYRAGQASPLKMQDQKKHEQIPFISSA